MLCWEIFLKINNNNNLDYEIVNNNDLDIKNKEIDINNFKSCNISFYQKLSNKLKLNKKKSLKIIVWYMI